MAAHESDNSSENKQKNDELQTGIEHESLFIRSNDDNSNAVSNKKELSSERPLAGNETDAGASLFQLVMKDKPVKNEAGFKDKTAEKSSKVEGTILGNFELVGSKDSGKAHDAKAIKDGSEQISDAEKAKVKNELLSKVAGEFEKSAYKSAAAAMVTVSSKLANDTGLTKLLSGNDGNVSKDRVNDVMAIDAGREVHRKDKNLLGPHLLTEEQRNSLDTVRTHMDLAFSLGRENQIAGSEFSLEDARKIGNEVSAEISKEINKAIESGDSSKTIDPKIIDEISRKVVESVSEKISDGKIGGLGGIIGGRKIPDSSEQNQDNPERDLKDKSKAQAERSAESQDKADVPQLSAEEFADVAKQVLAKIDTNKNGELTKDELAKALQDPSIKGKEAQALAAMYQNFDRLHNLSKHEGFFSSKSITAADLDKFKEVKAEQDKRVTEAFEMKTWAHNNLSKFDSNESGSLTKDELDKAINDPKTSAHDKAMLEAVKKHYSEMGRFWESGVNLQAFDNYAKHINGETEEAKLSSGVWASTYNVSAGQKANVSHDLYGDKNDPLKSINPDAIKQGSIGNCYFLASLAAVAKSNPEAIKNMIKDNGDGTYTVTFPGAKDEPITVKAPTEAEQGLYNHGSPNGTWASVMEKAYGEYCQKHFYRRSPFNLGGGDTPTEGADGGGRTGGVTELLTGHSSDTDMLFLTSQETTADKLERAFSSNPPKAVTAGISKGILSDTTDDKFYTGHAYSIVGFKPDGKGGGMVTIRNPWGGADNTTDGTITIPLDKFMKNFSDINYQV